MLSPGAHRVVVGDLCGDFPMVTRRCVQDLVVLWSSSLSGSFTAHEAELEVKGRVRQTLAVIHKDADPAPRAVADRRPRAEEQHAPTAAAAVGTSCRDLAVAVGSLWPARGGS